MLLSEQAVNEGYFFFDEDFLRGTLAPSFRGCDNPMAIACFLLVTFLPDLPLFSVPFFRSCIAFSTFLDAFLLYLAIVEIIKVLLAADADRNLPRVSVGGGEVTLLSYMEEKTKSSRGGGGKRDDHQEEIVRLLKNALGGARDVNAHDSGSMKEASPPSIKNGTSAGTLNIIL